MRKFVASSLIVMVFSQIAWPQSQAEAARTDWVSVLSLKPDVPLRVDFKNGTTLKGRFDSLSGEKLRLRKDKALLDVERTDVSKLYRSQGSIGRSVAFGTLIGAGSGAVFGVAVVATPDSGWFQVSKGEAAGVGALAGGVIGAGVGLLIGALRKKQVVVYETR